MHLLDLIIVFVLLPGITECGPLPGHEIINDCGHLKILNHENLYYGENVTLTFQPTHKSIKQPELNNSKGLPFMSVVETSNETYTFVIYNPRTTLQYADFYVENGCRSGFVRLRFKAECVPSHEITDDCGHLKILNHENLYFGGNVILTFQPKNKSNEHMELNNTKGVPFDYVNETSNETYTFVLLNCQETLQYADFYVKYGCTTGYVRLRFKVTRQDTPTYTSTPPTTIAKIDVVDATIQSLQPRQRDGSSSTLPKIQRNDVETDIKDQTVLKPSAANDGSPIVIIVVVCAVLVLIIVVAVVIAVCVKRKSRPVAKVPVQATQLVGQVDQKEGHDDHSVHDYEVVPDDNPERGTTPMYTSLQMAEIHLYTGLQSTESRHTSSDMSTYHAVAEQKESDVPRETNTNSDDKTYYNLALNRVNI